MKNSFGPEKLLYKEANQVLYLRAQGHITAALCADLRSLVFARFDAAPPVTAMYVDLSLCDYMDSTFLGLLVGFHKRLESSGAGKLKIIRPTAEAHALLSSMSILTLVEIIQTDIPFPAQMDNVIKTQLPSAELLLKMHESLMDLSDENVKRFSTLRSMLKDKANKPPHGE